MISVADPANPSEVGNLNTPGSAQQVGLSGALALVADDTAGLRVIDISNPAEPDEIGFCDTTGYVSDVAVSGSYVYIADWSSGLRVIDFGTPANPVEVGFYLIAPAALDMSMCPPRTQACV